jgi:hypothetical protein
MKKIVLFTASILLLTLASCGGIKTGTTGVDNQSFLAFVGKPSDYKGGVDVVIDDKTNFKADVTKDYSDNIKGNVYAISTGAHTISVSYNGKVVYKKQLFLANQETRKIMLP